MAPCFSRRSARCTASRDHNCAAIHGNGLARHIGGIVAQQKGNDCRAISMLIALFSIVTDTVLGLRSVDPDVLDMTKCARRRCRFYGRFGFPQPCRTCLPE